MLHSGLSDAHLLALPSYRTNVLFTDLEKLIPSASMKGSSSFSVFASSMAWVIAAVRASVAGLGELAGGILIVDESSDEKFGDASVGVFLSYVSGNIWSWVDGEFCLPDGWFSADYAGRHLKAGVPVERTY